MSEEVTKQKFNIKKLIAPVILFIIMVVGAIAYPVGDTVSIQTIYGGVMNGSQMRVYYDLGEGLKLENTKASEVADFGSRVTLKHHVGEYTEIGVAPTDLEEICGISTVNIEVNGENVRAIEASEIENYFANVNGVGYYDADENLYYFLPSGEEAYLLMSGETYHAIVDETIGTADAIELRTRIAICALFVIILSLIIFNFSRLNAYLTDIFDTKEGLLVPIAFVAFVAATLAVLVIGLRSELGMHPDEWDVFACLKYGMSHILPPDIRDPEVQSTFSGYGYTKLANGTYYFLIAGKVAAIAKFFYEAGNWFRIPNILLFLAMGYLYVKNIKKRNYLVLALGMSVQAWYIFSYVTADALDFFFSFLVLLALTDEDGMLIELLTNGITKKNWWKGVLLGVLFGMVFIGKQNYWTILGLAFIVLLFRLIRTPKDSKKGLLRTYIFILIVFVVTVGTRYGIDFAHYGTHESEIKYEYDVMYADYDKNPETPKQDRHPTYKMYENGYAISDLFEESTHWFRDTFHSFCGLLEDYETSQMYYTFMGLLYIVVIMTLLGHSVSAGKSKSEKTELLLIFALLLVNLLASIGNSYFSDSMAQGRYLLAMVLILSYLGFRNPEAFKKRYFTVSVILLNVLQVWYYCNSALTLTGVLPLVY